MSFGIVPRGSTLYHKKRRNARKWEHLTEGYATYLVTSEPERKWRKIVARSGIIARRRNLLAALQESFELEDPWVELRTEDLLYPLVQQDIPVTGRKGRRISIGRRCCACCGRSLTSALRDPVLRDILWRLAKRLSRLSWKAGTTVAVVAWTADQAGYSKSDVLAAVCAVIWKSLQHVR